MKGQEKKIKTPYQKLQERVEKKMSYLVIAVFGGLLLKAGRKIGLYTWKGLMISIEEYKYWYLKGKGWLEQREEKRRELLDSEAQIK